jgi:hypothetical protein
MEIRLTLQLGMTGGTFVGLPVRDAVGESVGDSVVGRGVRGGKALGAGEGDTGAAVAIAKVGRGVGD